MKKAIFFWGERARRQNNLGESQGESEKGVDNPHDGIRRRLQHGEGVRDKKKLLLEVGTGILEGSTQSASLRELGHGQARSGPSPYPVSSSPPNSWTEQQFELIVSEGFSENLFPRSVPSKYPSQKYIPIAEVL
jgi:hypothetical protein